jgi:hypothetical protein
MGMTILFAALTVMTDPVYSTATIKYQNGTVVNVGKIDAGEKHKEMMLKLSLDSSRRSR